MWGFDPSIASKCLSNSYNNQQGSYQSDNTLSDILSGIARIPCLFGHYGQFIYVLATGVIGFFTWQVARFTETLGRTTETQSRHFKITERPYVRLSHGQKPGLLWNDSGRVWMAIDAINRGKTPATITAIAVTTCKAIWDSEAKRFSYPNEPDYSHRLPDNKENFVGAGESAGYDVDFKITLSELQDIIANRDEALCIIGYVEYTDMFGDKYVGGYARRFDPHRDGADINNLVVIGQPNWNYDRPRPPDWERRSPPPKES